LIHLKARGRMSGGCAHAHVWPQPPPARPFDATVTKPQSGPGSPGAQSLLTVNFGYLGGPHVGGGGVIAVGAGGGAAALRAAAAEGRLRAALRVCAQLAGDAALRRKVGLRQAEVAGCQTSWGSSLQSRQTFQVSNPIQHCECVCRLCPASAVLPPTGIAVASTAQG